MLSYDKEINGLSAPLTKICSERKEKPHYICKVELTKQLCSSKNNNNESNYNPITHS